METKTLTASEVGNIWNSYLTNTMAIWVSRHFLKITQDQEIHQMLEFAEEIAVKEVKQSQFFFEEAQHPLPKKFDEQDVNVNAPALYSDKFILMAKYKLAQDANVVYAISLATSTRSDIREFYETCLMNSAKLLNQCTEIMVKKGMHHPRIHVPVPDQIDLVDKQSFVAGWFADRRALNVFEIHQLELCFRGSEVHKEFLRSFAQVTSSKDLKEYYQHGAEIIIKHLEIFQSILSENGLPQLPTWESEITDLRVAPFSERLMLYKATLLTAAQGARYGTALSSVMRKDLGAHFLRLVPEVLKYGEDGTNLMIKHGFLDQMPIAEEGAGS